MKKVIDRGKRSQTLSDVELVENISKNLQSFLWISPMQNEVLLCYIINFIVHVSSHCLQSTFH